MSTTRVFEFPSRRFGRYRVLSRLGRGGMAEVFLAEAGDDPNEQPLHVALKLMGKEVSDEAFADEADLMSLLDHPNLVGQYEVGHAFGRAFIAMELLAGGDLETALSVLRARRQTCPPAVALHLVVEVLRGLAYFHRAKTRSGRPLGLVHGDVTPANVFFSTAGEVKLGDFGVAKSASLGIGPADGITAGKLHYLSPEQIRGDRLTPQSDLFSLAIVLHELLLGAHPFAPDSHAQVQAQPTQATANAVMAALRAAKLVLPETLDPSLSTILRRALHPDPAARYGSAGEFAGALLEHALDHDLHARAPDVRTWLSKLQKQ